MTTLYVRKYEEHLIFMLITKPSFYTSITDKLDACVQTPRALDRTPAYDCIYLEPCAHPIPPGACQGDVYTLAGIPYHIVFLIASIIEGGECGGGTLTDLCCWPGGISMLIRTSSSLE